MDKSQEVCRMKLVHGQEVLRHISHRDATKTAHESWAGAKQSEVGLGAFMLHEGHTGLEAARQFNSMQSCSKEASLILPWRGLGCARQGTLQLCGD